MSDSSYPLTRSHDVADVLADNFPGHTMQRLRTADGKYRYLYVSAGIKNSFELDADELMKADSVDHEWVHAEDRSRFVSALETSALQLTPLDIEVRVKAPNGGYRWVRSIGKPRQHEKGAVIWDGVALDVTDRREALDALQRALSEARRSEVTEGRFNYIAAQDLGAPLLELRASADILRTVDRTDTQAVSTAIDGFTACFDRFENALAATQGLIGSQSNPKSEPTVQAIDTLTNRQNEILAKISDGASNREIARSLGITEGTVKLHVSAILKRLMVKNRTEATKLFRQSRTSQTH
jgi:DNA-binding NarL/FixJ family response regulator